MSIAMWVFLVLSIIFGGCAALSFPAANRSSDDFGAGILLWLLLALTVVFLICFAIAWMAHRP